MLGASGLSSIRAGHQLHRRCQWPTAKLPGCPGPSRRARHSCIEGASVTFDSPDHTIHVLSHRRSWGEPGRSHHQGQPGHPVCQDSVLLALTQCGPRYTPGCLDIPASGPHITECEKETPEAAFEQAATSGIRPWKLSADENAFPGVSLRDPAIASPDDGRTHGTGAFHSTDLKAVSALALILVCQHWTSRTLSPWLGLRLQGFKEPRSEQKPLP